MANISGTPGIVGANGTIHAGPATLTEEAVIIACAGAAVLPLCLMRSIDKLGFTSLIGIIAMLFTYVNRLLRGVHSVFVTFICIGIGAVLFA